MNLLLDKNFLVTGIVTEKSIAFNIAKQIQHYGGNVIASSFGRVMSITQRIAKRLPKSVEVIELDVSNIESIKDGNKKIQSICDNLDGIVHSVAYASNDILGRNFLNASFDDVSRAINIGAYSLKELVNCNLNILSNPSSIVGIDFDAKFVWPGYDWMGIVKAALENISRYMAFYLGDRNIRVNLISAGPIDTLAANALPDFQQIKQAWNDSSPLNWNNEDVIAVGRTTVALLSNLFEKTTGEIIHVDGGMHIMGNGMSIKK